MKPGLRSPTLQEQKVPDTCFHSRQSWHARSRLGLNSDTSYKQCQYSRMLESVFCWDFIHRNAFQSKYPGSMLMKIGRPSAAFSLTEVHSKISTQTTCCWKLLDALPFIWSIWPKRNITGRTGCKLGLFISNWTPSDWQLCWRGFMQVFFHFWLQFSPWGQGPDLPSFPGHKVRSGGGVRGAHMGIQGETFMQPSNFLASSSSKKFPLSAKPFKLPKQFGNYSISCCCQLGNLLHCINWQKTKHTFWVWRNIFVSLSQKGQRVSLSG